MRLQSVTDIASPSPLNGERISLMKQSPIESSERDGAFDLAIRSQMVLPLLGERAGVRADVLLTFHFFTSLGVRFAVGISFQHIPLFNFPL